MFLSSSSKRTEVDTAHFYITSRTFDIAMTRRPDDMKHPLALSYEAPRR